MAVSPEIPYGARSNRAFLGRAVRYMTEQGVTQFLDLGSGIPTQDPTHEVAARSRPDARVVYVDRDPIAVAHSRALLADDDRGAVLHADIRDPKAILGSDVVTSTIDFSRPVGLLLLALLHFFSDDEDPMGVLATLADAVVPGSYLVLSHVSPPQGADIELLAREMRKPPQMAYLRDRDEIARFFDGWDLIEPGLVPPALWRPEGVPGQQAYQVPALAGVGRRS